MYKIDNKNWRAKIKNLKRLDFQKYNIKEKQQKEKGKKEKKATRIIKKNKQTPITTQRLYMVFALKKKRVFFLNINNRL